MTMATSTAISTGQMQGAASVGAAARIQKDANAVKQAKLAEAAQKFEGMMLEELMKPMQKAGSVGGAGFGGDEDAGEGADEAGPSMDTFSSYGVEAMAEALAKSGGLGLAKQVLSQIGKLDERGREKSSSTKV